MNKYAFVTVLSTENYLDGVLALFKSIEQTNTKFPNFITIVNDKISEHIKKRLEQDNITVISRKPIEIPEEIRNRNLNSSSPNWNYTFDKFYLFTEMPFDKIIYLDSDMYVAQNIDELFEEEHMSATIAGKSYPTNNHWTKLNSGLMVIEPKYNILDELIELLSKQNCDAELGDQDIIELYYKWEEQEDLHIEEKYNIFANYIDYYIESKLYLPNELAVIHFIGKEKPWMLNKEEIEQYRKKCKEENKKYQLDFFNKYIKIIQEL